MSIKVMGFDGNPMDQRSIKAMGDRFITQLNQLVFSGNYVTGGDTLDWSNGGGLPANPNTIPPAAQGVAAGPSRVTVNDNGPAAGLFAAGGYYRLIPGTLPTNWKVIIYDHTGAEIAAAGYPAAVTADTVILESEWAR